MTQTKPDILPNYLEGASPAQLEVILGEEAVKQVVAAAGSGKTRTVTGLIEYRLREGLEEPGKVLLLSFSGKAVKELRSRLSAELRSGVEVSTFHAFCLKHLRHAYPRALKKLGILTEEKKEEFFRDFLLGQADHRKQIGGIPIPLLWEQPETFNQLFPALCEKTWQTFREYKRVNRLFEFEDLIETMLHSLRKNKKATARAQKHYDLIIVDEFQDTDLRQLEFLQLMQAARKVVVGDDWQAIYAFRGASLQSFLDFQRIFQAKQLRLCDNYRSLKNIVELGNRIIRASSKQISKKVHAIRGSGPGLPVLSLSLEGSSPKLLADCLAEQGHEDYYLLVRTNWRRKFWLSMGLPEERVMTIHKSKGLEFPVVFLDLCSGWSKKTRPKHSLLWPWDKSSMGVGDEEIRILYVGASRSMNLLIVLHQPPKLAGERERLYYEKLIAPEARACSLDEVGKWLSKEACFRRAA